MRLCVPIYRDESFVGYGLVRPFDRLRAVSEVEPQAHYKSVTYAYASIRIGFVFSLNTTNDYDFTIDDT